MFSISQQTENGLHKIVLKNENGIYAEILAESGAVLNAFGLKKDAIDLNVIDGYDSVRDFVENVEEGGFRSAKLAPFACRLTNGQFQLHETNYKIEKFYMKGHAIHGLMYDAVYDVKESLANEEEATVKLVHEYRGTDAGYPWPFTMEITYSLKNNSTLGISTTITNNSEEVIPVVDGWHPYFKIGDTINDLQLQFKCTNMLEFSEDLVPTGNVLPYSEFIDLQIIGETELDNSFTADFSQQQPLITLQKEGILSLEIHPSESYRFIQIYTPPHRRTIAIENLSGAPDAFNNGIGLIYLLPKEAAQFETKYKLVVSTEN